MSEKMMSQNELSEFKLVPYNKPHLALPVFALCAKTAQNYLRKIEACAVHKAQSFALHSQ
jgi:hypothetical protein